MKKRKNLYLGVSVIMTFLICMGIGSKDTYSAEMNPQTDQTTAEAAQQNIQPVTPEANPQPASPEINPASGETQPTDNSQDQAILAAQLAAIQQAEAAKISSEKNTAAKTAETKDVPLKVSSTHYFKTIDEAARNAFISFSYDNRPDSMYLNIDHTSTDNIMTGKELNHTRTSYETGVVSFVDGEKIVSVWEFTKWRSDDDYKLDLTSGYTAAADLDYPDTYRLTVKDGIDFKGNEVVFKVNTGLPNTEVFYLKENGDSFKKLGKGTTDEEGYLTLDPRECGSCLISKTDLSNPQVIQALAEQAKKEEEERKKAEDKALEEALAAAKAAAHEETLKKEQEQAKKEAILKAREEAIQKAKEEAAAAAAAAAKAEAEEAADAKITAAMSVNPQEAEAVVQQHPVLMSDVHMSDAEPLETEVLVPQGTDKNVSVLPVLICIFLLLIGAAVVGGIFYVRRQQMEMEKKREEWRRHRQERLKKEAQQVLQDFPEDPELQLKMLQSFMEKPDLKMLKNYMENPDLLSHFARA